MNIQFERTGSLTELTSYPQWAQDMVNDCAYAKQSVLDHDVWRLMREGRLDAASTRNFMVGVWPVIERFPAYMSLNLLKTRFGRSVGENLARRWLVRNIRVEQNHAEYWLNWADGAGVETSDVLNGAAPHGMQTLANWCEDISARGSLAAGVAATNYAVEGATGEWSQLIYDSVAYRESFPEETRAHSLRWLRLHAAYDDMHPWEALEIVCTLLGTSPHADEVAYIGECVRRSYTSMRITLDRCEEVRREARELSDVAA
ncbi:TenA family transcriptional regulator [Dokdonella soli]|uniref:TenA family transcriptional regulator n=1 Tax=Dokdonella soli TaxID=529810 RepID=A0ABN1ICN2_9GAMM